MTATYTANLASLFVAQVDAPVTIESIEDAIAKRLSICTYSTAFSGEYIREKYPKAIIVPGTSEEENFDDLRTGKCDVAAVAQGTWDQFARTRKNNPYCDLEAVGTTSCCSCLSHCTFYFRLLNVSRTQCILSCSAKSVLLGSPVLDISAGFATKADSGDLCSGLIRDVLNVHFVEMEEDSSLYNAWEESLTRITDINCAVYDPDNAVEEEDSEDFSDPEEEEEASADTPSTVSDSSNIFAGDNPRPTGTTITVIPFNRNRRLQRKPRQRTDRRKLKMSGLTRDDIFNTDSSDTDESSRLSIEQMAGTFFLHYILTGVSVIMAVIINLGERLARRYKVDMADDEKWENEDDVAEVERKHGIRSFNSREIHELNVLFEDEDSDYQTRPSAPSTPLRPQRRLSSVIMDRALAAIGDGNGNARHSVTGAERSFAAKKTKPIIQNKDSRYLQLQIEEVQEAQEKMQRQMRDMTSMLGVLMKKDAQVEQKLGGLMKKDDEQEEMRRQVGNIEIMLAQLMKKNE